MINGRCFFGEDFFIGVDFYFISYIYRSTLWQQFTSLSKPDIYLTILFAIGTITFVSAIKHTVAAKALIILSAAPVFSAIFSYIFLREKISLRSFITIIIVISTFVFMFFDSLKSGSLYGDFNALCSAAALAGVFVISRHKKKQVFVPLLMAGLIVSAFCYPLANVAQVDKYSFLLIIFLGFILAASFVLLTLAPKYIPAPEVSLIMLLETILGSFLVWLFLDEVPGLRVIIGGVIILLALSFNSLFALKR